MPDINKTVTTNFLWRFMERCGAQGVALIVSIVLARLLEPSMYGIIAMVTVFTTILQVFIDSGLGNALIQKKDADDLDFSTVFYFNIIICLFLYTLMFVSAPAIACFYKMDELTNVIRVLSLTLIISGLKNVQQAYVSRNMLFKKFFFATLGGTIIAAILGIYMAYSGFGVWALVMQQLTNATIDTVILWFTVKWRPKRIFSFKRLKRLLSFGWKILVAKIIDTLYSDIRQLVIGKIYSSADLAYYNQGKKYTQIVVENINSSIDSVLFPTMSKEQDNIENLKRMTRRSIKTSTYLMAPLMIGLAFTSNNVVEVVLTSKWLPCVQYMWIFCITFLFYPIHTANLNAIKALGRSDLFLKLEIAKKLVGVVLLLSTMFISPFAMAASLLVSSITSQFINSWPNKKLLNYPLYEQWKDISSSILLSLIMGIVVFCVGLVLPTQTILKLIVQVIVGAMIYLAGSIIFKYESFYYVLSILKSMSKRSRSET